MHRVHYFDTSAHAFDACIEERSRLREGDVIVGVAGRDVAPDEVEGKSNRRQPITRIARLDRPHHRTKIRHPIGLRWGGGANTSPRFHRLIDRITKVLGRSSECGVAGGRRHGSPSGSDTHEHR